jgi:hypothetical protein
MVAPGEAGDCRALQPRLEAAKLPHIVRIDSEREISETVWVEIYELMGKHVEDARVADPSPPLESGVARIVDIMRAINSDDGVRGRLARMLASPPVNAEQWEQARSEAAIVAEAGNLLLARRPSKGSAAGWRERSIEFRTAAETLLRAVEAHDFSAAQEALRTLPKTCAACHAEYR